jgi:L-asparagine transporter-like permease
MAGNCLIFGIRILQACNVPPDPNTVRGIAVAVATLACGIHAFSRRGGIWLGNLLALIKVLLLLMVIVTGICAWAGAFKTNNYVSDNMALGNSFADPAHDSYGYAQAFLAVLFAWSGFDQPNYVS